MPQHRKQYEKLKEIKFIKLKTKTMKTKSFPHNFTTAFGVIDMAGIVGYQKCLAHLNQYINENENKAYGYIHTANLRSTIKVTTLELKELMDNETSEIKEELANLTKYIKP